MGIWLQFHRLQFQKQQCWCFQNILSEGWNSNLCLNFKLFSVESVVCETVTESPYDSICIYIYIYTPIYTIYMCYISIYYIIVFYSMCYPSTRWTPCTGSWALDNILYVYVTYIYIYMYSIILYVCIYIYIYIYITLVSFNSLNNM